jgi:hypothetical protein
VFLELRTHRDYNFARSIVTQQTFPRHFGKSTWPAPQRRNLQRKSFHGRLPSRTM